MPALRNVYLCCLLLCNFCLHPLDAYVAEEKGSNGEILPKEATFHFPEYAYKETSKNEIIYHGFEVACEHSAACENLDGVLKKACVRRCISTSCYQDIYQFDELEDGEIDVRLNSFKGCVIQRHSTRR